MTGELMTVRELIAVLSAADPDIPVAIMDWEYGLCEIEVHGADNCERADGPTFFVLQSSDTVIYGSV